MGAPVLITAEEVLPFGPRDSVIRFRGVDDDTGRQHVFGADHSVAEPIIQALYAGESPVCEVPAWRLASGDVE